MTCIVGMAKDGVVMIGGDSAGVNAWHQIETRSDEKVFRNGPMIMGFTSSFRMGQLLKYKLVIPQYDDRVDVMKYMVTDFVDAVRTVLRESGFTTITSNNEVGGYFLVGFMGRLFKIEGDFQVAESSDGIMAVGCGDQAALGSMHTMTTGTIRERLQKALEVSERLSGGVKGPFVFEVLQPYTITA